MKSIRPFTIIILIALVSQACSLTNRQPAPGDVLFSDDFSNTKKKWDRISEGSRTTDYLNDAYQIIVNEASTDAWANPGSESYTDVRIEVDATKNGGPDDNDFGVICRYTDVDKFYYAVISSDGYYGIMKMSLNGGNPIGSDSLLESDQITMGTGTNHIRFDCIGSQLSLYVNDKLIAQQTDADYVEGNVGLIAGTFDTPGTDILFDNFYVYKP